jgi:hypothetical protein
VCVRERERGTRASAHGRATCWAEPGRFGWNSKKKMFFFFLFELKVNFFGIL